MEGLTTIMQIFGFWWDSLLDFFPARYEKIVAGSLLYYIFSGEKHKSSEIFTLTTLPFSLQVKWGRGLPPAMHFNKVELPGLSWRSGLVKMKYGSRLLLGCNKVEKEWSDFGGLEMRGSANGNIGGSMSSSSRTSNLAASLLTLWDFSSMTMHW